MTLKDHFHDPLDSIYSWESIHAYWNVFIATELNRVLPPGFTALPQNRRTGSLEIDVAAYETAGMKVRGNEWELKAPPRSLEVQLPDLDHFEIRVMEKKGIPRLVGAIELVSPANKDRPYQRQMFAGKCAGFLRKGIGLVVIDVVTNRHQNLHGLILEMLELNPDASYPESENETLTAISYRTVADRKYPSRLDLWPNILTIGGVLPTLPLWLAGELAVPVDLAKSYAAVCESLRIE